MIPTEFGLIIRQKRRKKRLTQQGLAHACGLSLRFIQEIEAGDKQPTLTTLFLLAHGLGTTPAQLITPVWQDWQKTKETP